MPEIERKQLTSEEAEMVRQSMARILSSPMFEQSARQRRFLEYIVDHALSNDTAKLKGYSIGLDVFDRPEDFDPGVDSIVRVEAARLRSKLREFYESCVENETIKIDLPKGGYTPIFQFIGDTVSTSTKVTHASPASQSRSNSDRPSLMVLPFRNLSADPEQEYFVDGITDDLITGIAKLSGLKVIARQSAFFYKDKQATAHQIAEEVDVRYLLEGSVRKVGNRARVSASLIVGATDETIWQESYDRDLEDIFAVQDDVVRNIVDSLELQLTARDQSRLKTQSIANIEAHDLLSRGRERFWTYMPDGVDYAQSSFRRAIEIAPNYAVAYAWLARTVVFTVAVNWEKNSKVLDDALEYVHSALRIDPNLPFIHGIASWTHLWRKEIDQALVEGQLGVDIDVNDADAHMFFSLALSANGNGEAALAQAKTAEELNPHPPANSILANGLAYIVLNESKQAIATFELGIARNPNFVPFYVFLAAVCAKIGDRETAVSAVSELHKRTGQSVFDNSAWQIFVDEDLAHEDLKYRQLAVEWFKDAR